MLTLHENRLGILSPLYLQNHRASSAVSALQQRPKFNLEEGVVAVKIRSVTGRVHALAAAALTCIRSSSTCRISTQYAGRLLTFAVRTPCSRLNLGSFGGAETTLLA